MSAMEPAALHDVVLDDDGLAQLVLDVEHAAQLLEIVIRPRAARTATPPRSEATLLVAHQVLRDKVASVQLRYRFGDEEWWDTLMPLPVGVRLVRINHSEAVHAANTGEP